MSIDDAKRSWEDVEGTDDANLDDEALEQISGGRGVTTDRGQFEQ